MSAAPTTGDRRRGERRSKRRKPPAEESFFGAFGVGEETQVFDDAGVDEDESRYEGGWVGRSETDSRFLSRQARRLVGAGQTAFYRIYRVFLGARAALGIALILTLVAAGVFGGRPTFAVALISVAYAALALSMWLLPHFQRTVTPHELARLRGPQWLATIGADIASFNALHLVSHSSSFNYVALLVLPVLMAGVLTPRAQALATAAVVALALLGTAWLAVLSGGDATALMTQAGLAGSGLFVITVLAGELAGRLAREELTAKGSLELARQQAQLNRLVIEEMQDGVLVVDRRGRVRAANPAARRLLAPDGMCRPAPFQLRGVEAWESLVRTVERAFVDAVWPEAGRDVVLEFEPGETRTLRVRIRFTRRLESQASEDFCVLLLEDVRNMQARTRQEKLAAMGRVSAGIAHEIRNPLAAIAQANALLSEDATTPSQRQLTRMVTDNVERLKRIVDDVMEVAPGTVQDAGVIDVGAQVAVACSEWARAAGIPLGDSSALRVDLPADPLGGVFDAEHLRRVLINLLDNAYRHASKAPGSVHLRLYPLDDTKVQLSVASDGAPIPPDVERYLFEPFFSTRSRGTGLGLYICRELCERYGASIEYRLRPPAEPNRNEFQVAMRRQALTGAEARLHLTS
ncbi:sensor histidine kinase [Piscinibacter sp.]|jgi:two-component system sensor histidine kinase PilS (NtrC family)|uniref:sensor histidine kinase n=1 Tax=Piscinibacter sp. TaxID=1903157 RepID=UPI0035598D7B